MLKINGNYENVQDNYLFAEIGRRVATFCQAHPDQPVIRMGIGDVTRPLCPAVVEGMQAAVAEMGDAATFRGYGPYQGYAFVREAIQGYYGARGVSIDAEEIFVSDGAKSDVGNILDLFDRDNTVMIPDPVYPVYVDTNKMDGRNIVFLNANETNSFLPLPPRGGEPGAIIYLCSPNNPTGAVYDRVGLKAWVDYANEHEAVILFDAAYEAFVRDAALPRSIFEIEGANHCAIEFCSLSKTAGFTGTRCGYTVVPKALRRGGRALWEMWLRRQTTKFNGVSYIVQCGAAQVFGERGLAQIRENIDYYAENAREITRTLDACGVFYTGGVNSPYVWFKCPKGMGSWELFDLLLARVQVVGTPGAGFGANGEGYFRLTAFGSHADTRLAMARLQTILK